MGTFTAKFALLAAAGALLLGTVAALPGSDSTAGWYRVEFEDRVTQADRELLTGSSDAVHAAGGDAYVVWGDPGEVPGATIAALDAKVHPGARAGSLLTVLAHPSSAAELSALLGVTGELTDTGLTRFLVPSLPLPLADLAAHPGVLHVGPAATGLTPEDEASAQIVAGNSQFTEAPPGYGEFLAEHGGLTGDGVNVTIVDTGIDRLHPDISDRVIAHLDYTPNGEPHDVYGHGTHVAGIVGGDGSSGGLGITDRQGRLYGLGVAPGVGLLDQNAIALTVEEWPPPYGFGRLTADAIDHDTHIWNASWTTGEGEAVGYVATAAELDALIRDGHDGLDGNQPFTMVFSAGNSGPGLQTLTSPKEAKNLIVVAASENVRTLTGGTSNGELVASFSSRGPAMDGRVVPQVTAPGANVISSRATPAYACNLPPQDAGATMYAFCSGTSMAAPHVTGAVALLTEWWREAGHGDPSPALAKALLVNSAQDMFRRDVPNPHEGWGRINLGNLFDPATARIINDQATLLTEPDATYSRDIEVVDRSQPLRVSLAWTDAPGLPVADPADAALVNDLDLEVIAPNGETVYRGNVFADGWSRPGGEADRVDNLENVFIDSPEVGTYTVRVVAHRVPGDGVPGAGDETDQDFALVVSNAAAVDGGPTVVLASTPE